MKLRYLTEAFEGETETLARDIGEAIADNFKFDDIKKEVEGNRRWMWIVDLAQGGGATNPADDWEDTFGKNHLIFILRKVERYISGWDGQVRIYDDQLTFSAERLTPDGRARIGKREIFFGADKFGHRLSDDEQEEIIESCMIFIDDTCQKVKDHISS